MKRNLSIIAMAVGCLWSAPGTSQAFVVSDNNLTSTTLPDFSSSGTQISSSFNVAGGRLYALRGSFESTVTGNDISNYYIAGISKTPTPASASDLTTFIKWARSNNQAYPKTSTTLTFSTAPGDTTYYLALGMGVFSASKSGGYSWKASDLVLYTSAGAENNLVPNASFENTTVSFWSAGGSFVSAPGKQGSSVWQIGTTTDSHIALPVIVGQEYFFSFWSASPDIGSGHQIEYGFSVPQNAYAIGDGNTSINRYTGGGNISWTEYTGTFTPGEGQTTWYIGGMANGGALQFDSIYLAQIPEPSLCLLFALGGGLLLFRRCRSR